MIESTIRPTMSCALPGLVAAAAEICPDNIAVTMADQQLSYRDLIQRVTGLAELLHNEYGIRPGTAVPVLLERGIDMPVCLLAVLAAGGVCVPLSSHYPAERIQFIVADCGAQMLLTNIDASAVAPSGIRVVDVRNTDPLPVVRSGSSSLVDGADALAYYLYTSGSTGKPKGVMLTQRGIANVLDWATTFLAIDAGTVFLQRTTFTFDISLVELFAPLINGSTLVMLPPGAEHSPDQVRRVIADNGIDIVQFTPSGLATHLATVEGDPLPGVTRCLVAGEPLKSSLRDLFYASTSNCTLYNLYGPTEATIYATAVAVPRLGPITVGSPVSNTSIEIRSEDGSLCSPGTVGELWIGGEGVARGYLNNPDLTRERFIGEAFRSGDLGVWLPNGEIDLHGRRDNQVKIRGFRIELGEIENAMVMAPGVDDAAVTVVDLAGQPELAAYWVGQCDDSHGLAEVLRRTLPSYMVPTRYVHMASFPQTSSGKIDRNALPLPSTASARSTAYHPPRDDIERALCTIFQEILGWDRIGISDRFLDLGADSLKAARAVRRIHTDFNCMVDVALLLGNCSVETLAAFLGGSRTQSARSPLTPAPVAEWYPLTAGQKSMWLLEQGGAPHAAFTEPLLYMLTGDLDIKALRTAVERVLTSHEALRTAITVVAGMPRQRVLEQPELDWCTATVISDTECDSFLSEFVARDFDLVRGQLIRAAVISRSSDTHLFAIAMHHIATDGWSLSILIDEIFSNYNDCSQGIAASASRPAVQYKDFAVWQDRVLDGSEAAAAKAYWLNKLGAGEIEYLELPTDRPRATERTYRGMTIQRTLPVTAIKQLNTLCRQESATLFAGLITVWRVVLHRYTQQRDFALGTSVLGRPWTELEGQIGYYASTVALRDKVFPDSTFRDLLRTARATISDVLRFGDYPFERVVADLGNASTSDRHPFFDVMVMIDPGWGDHTVACNGIRVERMAAPNAHSKMDLTLFMKETKLGFEVRAEFSTEIFDVDRIDRLIGHFETVLHGAVADPDTPVCGLSLLSSDERHRLLHRFNDNAVDFGAPVPVHQLFEDQARQFPDRMASIDSCGALTYAELNDKADAIAATLRQRHHVGRGDIVALLMNRSSTMVASVLGVMKSGAAYLPLNVADPDQRLLALMSDSSPRVIVVDDPNAASRIFGNSCAVLNVSEPLEAPTQCGSDTSDVRAQDAAYCIYTSGSTGLPKGVVVDHGALFNRLSWMVEDLDLTHTDVFLLKTPYIFDVSVWEILLPGMLGARQVILESGDEKVPAQIHAAIAEHRVTVVHFVPSMLDQYLRATTVGFTGVRHCVTSGEALSVDLAERFHSVANGTTLNNYYGPTEAAIDVSAARVCAAQPITIGRPAPNNQFHILDDNGELLPIGIAGELHIAGKQLARGYLGRPELTTKSFVPNPFSPGHMLYRTGDIARWTSDGCVEYLGRADGQVKLRGFRIELGEIEHTIREVDGVDSAIVLLQHTASGIGYLRAFVTGVSDSDIDRVRQQCVERLPAYMVPTQFVAIATIPLTTSGKADRRVLATLSSAPTEARIEPLSATEHELLTLWQELLPDGDLGVTEDFFARGGNSLSALQLSARIIERFGFPATLATMFKFRTIADQAGLIDRSGATRMPATGILQRHPRQARHRLSYAQERMWFLQQLDPTSSAYNIPLFARLTGPLDTAAFKCAVADIVQRQEILRTTYTNIGEDVFQELHLNPPTPFEMRDCSDGDSSAVVREARRIAAAPFDIACEFPLRVVLFQVDRQEHHLLIVVHHIAGDGRSVEILLQELAMLYRHYSEADVAPPAEPLWQYIDYAESQRAALSAERIEDDLNYWVARLADIPPLELATDRTGVQSSAAGRSYATISAETSAALRNLSVSRSATVFEITVSVINLVLSRLSGQEDIAVGFPVSNRQDPGLDSVVGLFLNTLVLRTTLSGDPTFADLLEQVSHEIRDAYDHQSAPFELIVERLNPPRNRYRTPIFDVLINFQDDLRHNLELGGIDVTFNTDILEFVAKFALSFYIFDDGTCLQLEMAYRQDLFSAERAAAMLAQIRYVFEQVATAPDGQLGDYSLCAPGLPSWNADFTRPIETPHQPSFLEAILEHARKQPDHVSVEHGDFELTYQELEERSAKITSHLVAGGITAGEIVAVTGPAGIGFITALLGTMRSGAVVFPVDPALPPKRRAQLMAIACPTAAVIVGDEVAADLGNLSIVQRVDANTGSAEGAESSLVPAADPESPAYLFFTSGTTGRPRGVLGRRSGLDHFLAWQHKTFEIGHEDRCAQLTSPSFDVMLRDTLMPLLSGATLVIPQRSDIYGGQSMFRWLEQRRITVVHAVPTVLQSWLLDAPSDLSLPVLRWLFMAGEPLKAQLIESFRARCISGAQFVNLYGPTETTLAKVAHVVDETSLPALVPVGQPMPQCQVVVQRGQNTCGIGEPGEVVIRTPFRSYGYYNEPGGTAAAFVPNPRREDPGDIVYRTGDLGRLRPDGNLEIIGRIDSQVKINGIRIQPAEIEAALAGHSHVEGCLVQVSYLDGEPTLVAYVVSPGGHDDLGADLRNYLVERLPSAMVPRIFMRIERIPTTPNGKPDRAALPAPKLAAKRSHHQPQTTTQHTIQSIWTDVLAVPTPGIHDNFFELGGTSLKLLRLYHLLDERFPDVFRVAELFSHPTIATQAARVAPTDKIMKELVEHDF